MFKTKSGITVQRTNDTTFLVTARCGTEHEVTKEELSQIMGLPVGFEPGFWLRNVTGQWFGPYSTLAPDPVVGIKATRRRIFSCGGALERRGEETRGGLSKVVEIYWSPDGKPPVGAV